MACTPSQSCKRTPSTQDLTLRDEMGNLLLLVTLYMMQGVPLGLTMGSMYVFCLWTLLPFFSTCSCCSSSSTYVCTTCDAASLTPNRPPSPFLLQSNASYTQIGLFSLAAYPYSFKLLWSPLVDSVYSAAIGRRKSWIVPVQALSAVLMIGGASWLESRLQVHIARGCLFWVYFGGGYKAFWRIPRIWMLNSNTKQ